MVSLIAPEPYEKMMLFFLLFVSLPVFFFSPCPTGKTLEIVHLPRGRSWRPGHSFFSVRFAKIIPIMILLATGRMWLLKMDLWKNSYPPKNIGRWINPTPLPATELIPSANSIQEATFVFSRPTSLKVIIPDHKYHFTFPAGSFSWNFEIAEAELIWQGINQPQHLQSL